jgi:hypothetical protein
MKQKAICRYCRETFTFRWESDFRDECPACLVKRAMWATRSPIPMTSQSRTSINRLFDSWDSPQDAAQVVINSLKHGGSEISASL